MQDTTQFFRAGCGAMIINGEGLVFTGERAAVPGAWQLPQGGLRAGEEPLQAVYREIAEETGIPASRLDLLDTFPMPLAYELPADMQSEKTGRGQVQHWFLFRYLGDDKDIDIEAEGEFRDWQWRPFADVRNGVIAFRQPVYTALGERFRQYLA